MLRPLLCLALTFFFAVPIPAAEPDDLWLAVGYGGRRMISTDGLKWEITGEWAQPGGDDSNNLMSAVYAKGKFVVVGGGGGGPTGGGHILVSSDGREWKETLKDKSRINPVVFGNGRFIVGTSSYPSGTLMFSEDAETWTKGAKIEEPGLTHFRHGVFGNGVFVLVGNGQQQDENKQPKPIHWAIVTPDGEKITSIATDLPAHGDLHFGNGRFVMLSHDGILLSSADGRMWEEHKFPEKQKPGWLIFDGQQFLAGNYQTGWRSEDGVKWTDDGLPVAMHVKWTDGKRFVATGWPGKMAFSADGKKWERSPEMPANGINVVVKRAQPASGKE
jgi:hypothetical protein